MTYFEDLTEYTYGRAKRKMLNVGWIDSSQKFPTGKVSREFILNLMSLKNMRVAVMRGFHTCPFCEHEEPDQWDSQWFNEFASHSEIRVRGQDNQIYTSPSLITHYVTKHHYLPPAEYIQAIEECDVLATISEFETLEHLDFISPEVIERVQNEINKLE